MKNHSEGFLKIVNAARSRIRETTVDAVAERLKSGHDFVLVDVREDGEWLNGRIAGSIHVGKGVIERDIEQRVPDKSTPIVLYCGGGYRSALAADALQTMGYTAVESMDGGWRAWTEKNLPTER